MTTEEYIANLPKAWITEFELVEAKKKDLYAAAETVGMLFYSPQAHRKYVKASFFQAYADWSHHRKE